jgi:NFU1 iron-sulfur cluster scaffold homolog, mitochondrial
MAPIQVRFQPTPNPNAGKFVTDRTLVDGRSSRSFYNAEQAAADPVASALFALPGVASIFMVEDFVTVTKQSDTDWSDLIPDVTATMERVLS